MADDYSLTRIDDLEPEPSASSGTMHVNLVEALGCTEMRPKVWYLSEGDAMSFHRQSEQEEFYLVLEGPGRIRIGDDTHTAEVGTAIRIPPETRRQIRNDGKGGDGDHVWMVVGAPPVPDDGRPAED
jgi:mannose-6-phosphate isomerase-like protein (cupin superfamily)